MCRLDQVHGVEVPGEDRDHEPWTFQGHWNDRSGGIAMMKQVASDHDTEKPYLSLRLAPVTPSHGHRATRSDVYFDANLSAHSTGRLQCATPTLEHSHGSGAGAPHRASVDTVLSSANTRLAIQTADGRAFGMGSTPETAVKGKKYLMILTITHGNASD